MNLTDKIKGVLFGTAIGDALGVPVEFKTRDYLKKNPVTGFLGYGTYNQPPGSFSDDASLTFCLAEALANGFDLNEIANNFLKWGRDNYWAAGNKIFDIGKGTEKAIKNISKGIKPELSGGKTEKDNGNGSLMRIAPLVFYIYDKPINERFEIVKKVSSITHAHIRSVIACFYYLEYMLELLDGVNMMDAYRNLKRTVPYYLNSISIDPSEIRCFNRIFGEDIFTLPEKKH